MSTPIYDGRYSDRCKDDCQDRVCTMDIGEPYGCGSCCACLGGCRLGWEEQTAEADERTADASQRGETQ